MTVRNWGFIRIGALAVVVAAVLAITGSLQMQRTAHADPQTTIDAFIAAVNAGDGAAAGALFAENGVFIDINPNESIGVIGQPAITEFFTGIAGENIHVTLVSSNVNGTAISGVIKFSDNATAAAGVTVILQPFEAEVVNDQIVSIVFTYDTSDPDTAQYLAYLESQPDDGEGGPLPPDAQEMPMEGAQAGSALTGSFEGTKFLLIEMAPGAAGVAQPASIRDGTCAAPGAVITMLAPVLDGASFNLMSMTVSELQAGNYILVVEASESDATIVACGAFADLAAVPASPPVEALPDTGDGPSDRNVLATLMLVLAGAFAFGGVTLVAVGVRRRA